MSKQVLIIEDEAPAFRRLQQLIQEADPEIQIVEVIDSVSEAVKWWQHHDAPDLVFMDIQLADGLSFEIFEQVDINRPVIFTTAYDDYLLKAFRVNSIDYLLKPIDPEELAASLQKYEQLRQAFSTDQNVPVEVLVQALKGDQVNQKSRFLIKLSDRLLAVSISEIAYFYTHEGLVWLVTLAGNKYVIEQTMEELEGLLSPHEFFRINRQYIARFESIEAIHNYFKGKLKVDLRPAVKEEVLVSRDRAGLFKRWLDQ